jgi:hypothetical protein
MDVYEFIDSCIDEHLTLGDVKDLATGAQLDVVVWDRNFDDGWIYTSSERGRHYTPEEFFETNRRTLTIVGHPMAWEIEFPSGTHQHHMELCIDDEGNKWRPIRCDGSVMGADDSENNGMWADWDDDTRVGWRGPMMLWDRLAGKADVTYGEIGDAIDG